MQSITLRRNLLPAATIGFLVALTILVWAAGSAASGDLQIYGVAIEGYDTVAYFTEGRAMKGNPDINYDWNQARWHFATVEHRDMFTADPDKYAPTHAGF